MKILTLVGKVLEKSIEMLLCLTLGLMIFFACLQIALRGIFSGGLLWIDPFLRYLVIWSGMLGAVVATNRGKHISIDIVSYLIPEKYKPWLSLILHFVSVVVTAFLSWASFQFVKNEAVFGGRELLSIPSWGWNLVFPVCFCLISLSYIFEIIKGVVSIAQSSKGDVEQIK